MLYKSTTQRNAATILRGTLAFFAGIVALVKLERADQAYLDGMRPDELEDLGLRRTEDNRYRFY
jgi:hypothetical protein